MEAETNELMTVSISGIPIDLVERIDELAADDDRTRSSFLRRLIEQFVERRSRP